MAWGTRDFSIDEIDAAGQALIARRSGPLDVEAALVVVNNWRAAHAFPLNTMQMRLRKKASSVGGAPYIAQRTKRLPAIESKLRRLKNVTLSSMQDIGGCRAVVNTVAQVKLLGTAYELGGIRHELERRNNYIEEPTPHDYRSLHLIYSYYSDRNTQYDGQRIEIQIRSRLQHAWATAVEAVDTFANEQLKIHQDSKDFERFFALMGSWCAVGEGTASVPDTPENLDVLVDELKQLANDLHVEERLAAIGATARVFGSKSAKAQLYYLLDLDIAKRTLSIRGYPTAQSNDATNQLAQLEAEYRNRSDKDVLLVRASSIVELAKMYPNYRADTTVFIRELRKAVSSS